MALAFAPSLCLMLRRSRFFLGGGAGEYELTGSLLDHYEKIHTLLTSPEWVGESVSYTTHLTDGSSYQP